MPESVRQTTLRDIFAFEKVLILSCHIEKYRLNLRAYRCCTERQLHLNMKFGLQKLLFQSLASMDCEGLDKILKPPEISFLPWALPTACTVTLYSKDLQQDVFWWGHNLKLHLICINLKFSSSSTSEVRVKHLTIRGK